jgi:hypothetical protein
MDDVVTSKPENCRSLKAYESHIWCLENIGHVSADRQSHMKIVVLLNYGLYQSDKFLEDILEPIFL